MAVEILALCVADADASWRGFGEFEGSRCPMAFDLLDPGHVFLSSISLLKRMAWSLFGKIRLCDTVGANNGEDQWTRTYKVISPTSYKLAIYLSIYLSINMQDSDMVYYI